MVFYRIYAASVQIVRVLHGSRDIRAILGER
jgi:plasmid stabilization system protein ParE